MLDAKAHFLPVINPLSRAEGSIFMVFSNHVVCVLLTFDLFSPVGKITI